MEEDLVIKKLHLNLNSNYIWILILFSQIFQIYFWDDIDSNNFKVNVNEFEYKLDLPDRLSDVVSERSLKEICTKNLNQIVF